MGHREAKVEKEKHFGAVKSQLNVKEFSVYEGESLASFCREDKWGHCCVKVK